VIPLLKMITSKQSCGLPDEYDGYVTSVMSRMKTFMIHEAESFLKAYEDRINRKR
ncbi:hypothetical protein PIB30_059620, partial [Stylosanthes scabra]|nr:hypothetical protein [Stylosanthes scabra]